jgi:hypothetical protein
MRALLVSYLLVAAAAALWLSGLLIVAFPTQATALDFEQMFKAFLVDARHPVSLLMLLVIDIGLAIGLLRDFRVRDGLSAGTRLGVFFLAFLIFIIAAIIYPLFNQPVVQSHPFITAWCAFLSLGLLRAMSYAPPQRIREIRAPERSGSA